MPTVHQRKKALGIILTRNQLSTAGSIISKRFLDPSTTFGVDENPIRVKISIEGLPFQVWDYCDNFIPVIDSCIEAILKPPPEPEPVIEKPKRKRLSATKVKIDG